MGRPEDPARADGDDMFVKYVPYLCKIIFIRENMTYVCAHYTLKRMGSAAILIDGGGHNEQNGRLSIMFYLSLYLMEHMLRNPPVRTRCSARVSI